MNKLVVVAKNQQTYFIKRLTEEVKNVAFFNPWSDVLIPEGEKILVRTTGVYGNDLDLMMMQAMPQDKLINSLAGLKRFRTKPQQFEWFESEGISTLPWLSLKNTDLITIEKFFRLYPQMIVKPHVGQGGWGVEAHTWESFKSFWKKKQGKDEAYLLQPLIKGAKEFRYFFIQGQKSYTLERTAPSGVAANFKQQGKAILSQIPEPHLAKVEELAQKSGLFYGAIDLLIEDERHLHILEVNAVPGVEQLEQVSGENVLAQLLNAKFFCQIN